MEYQFARRWAAEAQVSDLFPVSKNSALILSTRTYRGRRVSIAPNALIEDGLRLGISPAEIGDGLRELISEGWLTQVNLNTYTAKIAVPARRTRKEKR